MGIDDLIRSSVCCTNGSGYTPAARAAIVQRECAALEERMAERAADIARLTMTVPAK